MYRLRRGAPDRAKGATACIMSLRIMCEIILVDFNLVVSTSTAKPKFNSPSNFLAIRYFI